MTKLDIIRKTKALFLKWNLHVLLSPFSKILLNAVYLGELGKWRKMHPVNGYNDFYQGSWDYSRRYLLYEALIKQEQLDTTAIDYLEFGVSGGSSFRWWLSKNTNPSSAFFGFDTFEGLPEKWGGYAKGAMAAKLETLNINDTRASFYKGLFQETLIPFLENYRPGNRKLIHMDADLFSATIFTLSQLYKYLNDGDIIMFDEFAVPLHEFLALKIFTENFYINYEVIAAANNYLFLAVKIKKDNNL
ncbi:MAG: TylF/MycF/NovP-related O-methyltransferase [Ferruginibacter sp.]